jgi:hypothetical protein
VTLTSDQMSDPLYLMTHNPANANRDVVQQFLSMEATCDSVASAAAFPYRSTGSHLTDWEAFYGSLGLGGDQPFLVGVFTLLLLGVS